MTGGAFFPSAAEEYDLDEQGTVGHAVQWVGTPGVKGPKWARMPLLTVGMLGIQCVWSIEMGYASPYLLELGLSKSWMSLVFMAGPLSGLIVQPLVGIFADRSKSRWGRRRPFMLAGVAVCIFAMMLLGWAKEIGSVLNSSGFAIFLAVWAIYLIDFSINAAMSTDRALVVDTLPPSQQEEGSAWAGRMFGFGSVAGFFVGNLDLTPVFPFLGKTQIQILSFLTSLLVAITHGFTAWAVTERVLLRDDRPQTQSSLTGNLRAIWDNIFALPPGIKTVCYVQFFSFIGWFPILFFTPIWVTQIYKSSNLDSSLDAAELEAEGVRAGSRALLCQAIINVIVSIGAPFFVAESGVQPIEGNNYAALNSGQGGSDEPPNSALWKSRNQDFKTGNLVKRSLARVVSIWTSVTDRSTWTLPIKGFTLVRLWWITQFVFAGAMAATWFVTTVQGAYFVIGVTGICWALAQWAPYSLLGELILIDGTVDRSNQLAIMHTRPSSESRRSLTLSHRGSPISRGPLVVPPDDDISVETTPYLSARGSQSSLSVKTDHSGKSQSSVRSHERQSGGMDLTPLVIQTERMPSQNGSTVVLRHSDEFTDDGVQELSFRADTPISPRRVQSPGVGEKGKGTADKAGVILGIHNVFLVLPQFIVTFLSSIIFYLMEPDKGLPAKHPNAPPVGNGTLADASASIGIDGESFGDVVKLFTREGGPEGGSPDAVGLIFRIGGISAAIGGWLCWQMARRWAKGQGI